MVHRIGGGGGNRTRVPWHFNEGFYVRGQPIEIRPGGLRQTGFRPRYLDSCFAQVPSRKGLTLARCGPLCHPRGQEQRAVVALSGHCQLRIGSCLFARCFTGPPDNPGTPPSPQPARSNPFAPTRGGQQQIQNQAKTRTRTHRSAPCVQPYYTSNRLGMHPEYGPFRP